MVSQRLAHFLKKRWDFVLYSLFGVLTTLVNYLVFLPLYNQLNFSAVISNSIAWIFSVIVAFLTNKPFVFKSKDWSTNVVVPEFIRFVSCRLLSGVAETLILLITVDFLCWNGNLWKILTTLFVIIINYVGSKMLVFRKK